MLLQEYPSARRAAILPASTVTLGRPIALLAHLLCGGLRHATAWASPGTTLAPFEALCIIVPYMIAGSEGFHPWLSYVSVEPVTFLC
jgi:hypothetical protein